MLTSNNVPVSASRRRRALHRAIRTKVTKVNVCFVHVKKNREKEKERKAKKTEKNQEKNRHEK